LLDINYAIRWLKQHAAEYSIDPKCIGGLGVSSGGHLILLAAMRPNDPRYASAELQLNEYNAELSYIVTCSGVLDPLARYQMAQAAAYAEIVACHRAYFGNEETMAEASPPLMLERGEPVFLPPLLMFQGGADPRLPANTAERTAGLYQAAGGMAEAHIYPAMGHALSEWGSAERADVLRRISHFVAQQAQVSAD
jgi:acetyl esterase/lipase